VDRYEIAKGTNMIDYAKQLADQVKGMSGVDEKMPGECCVSGVWSIC
jgi:hypothetical protein